MPIEFHCRICHAMIRVPDKAAGGKGKCPKCGIRITVPKKSTPPPAVKAPEEEQQFFIPGADEPSTDDEVPMIPDDPDAVIELEPATFEPSDLTSPPVGDFPFEETRAVSPVRASARRLKQRKQRDKSIIIGVVVALAAVAALGFFLVPILTAERLTGELTAATSPSVELPPILIDKSLIKFPSEELIVLLKKLEAAPLPMISSSMEIELTGKPKGLQISVTAGSQAQFYRVTLTGRPDVQKYLDRHLMELDERRLKEVDKAATDFFTDYQKALTKKSSAESIRLYRDSLAIPSLVGGFGYELVAEYGRGLYRCIYEDRDGGLYFLLPADVKSFRIVGREGTEGRAQVPVDFTVKVEGQIVPLKKTADQIPPKESKKPKPKPATEEPEMDDEKMDGKK